MNIDEGVVVHFRVLGPLVVEQEGIALSSISALMLRRLLASLLTRPNESVSVDDLISALWGQSAPPTARRTLLVYIRRLRTALGEDARIFHAPAGYRITVHSGELDSVEFGRLLSKVRGMEGRQAADLLSDALKLWRGIAYEDVREHFPIADEARSLDEERIQVEARHAELRLDLGEHAELIPRLTKLVEGYPFNEDFRRHLMLALYRCGRQSDALEVYRSTRLLLDEELGVEPGLALRQLHEAMLRSDSSLELGRGTAEAVIPRELPADIKGFVGRVDHLARLNTMLAGSSPVVISAIAGSAGIGKTTLAVHWAHQVAGHFPDGQLHINLRGFDPASPPVTAGEAIRRFLDALGVAAQRMPTGLEAQVALYRSLLADKRMLMILDNAHDAEQVRPLLPGSPTCLVVITSRKRLASLVATNNARPLMLDVLSDAESASMLTARLGADRIATSPDAVHRIIERCARLPLALAIASARAATEPSLSLAELATQLEDVHAFSSDDDPMTDLHAVFSWSYEQLSPAAARLFRLLGLHPGPDISAAAVASLAGQPIQHELAELTHAHMLSEHAPGRYTFHDLLRIYAAQLARSHDWEQDRSLAMERMLDHYLHTAFAADQLLDPSRDPIALPPPQSGVFPESPRDTDDAIAWFTREYQVILSMIRVADVGRYDPYPWLLVWAITTFVMNQGHWRDWAGIQPAAIDSACRLGNHGWQAYAWRSLGLAHSTMGDYDAAMDHLHRSLELYKGIDHFVGQAHVYSSVGMVFVRQGRNAEALEQAQLSLAMYRTAGHQSGQASTLNSVGWYHSLLGEHEKAISHCKDALKLLIELDHQSAQAATWHSIGHAQHSLGQLSLAVESYQNAFDLYRQVGDRYYQGDTLARLGDLRHVMGDYESARTTWNLALSILSELGHPEADLVWAKLSELDRHRTA